MSRHRLDDRFSTVGIAIVSDKFTDLDYTDDVVLLARKIGNLQMALEEFENMTSYLGLHVSWQKTKIHDFSTAS